MWQVNRFERVLQMKNKRVGIGAVIMLMLLASVTTFAISFVLMRDYFNAKSGNLEGIEQKYEKLKDVNDIIDKYFIAEYDFDNAMHSALRGFVDGLGDQWSGYYTPEETAAINESNSNTFVGIGVTLSADENDQYRIIKVEKDGPADKAGILPLDILTHVNGKSVGDFADRDAAVDDVRGEEGTIVSITVLRGEESISFDVKRATVHASQINYKMLDNNIGYIYINSFSSKVDVEFIDSLNALIDDGAKGFIFDVRFNGGGYVEVMNKMLDKLLPEGVVISMESKAGSTITYKSDAKWIEMPMVVITNNYSISAAEFFAASLQEYGVADVVGEKTNGKGYAQQMFPLPDGSSINLSTERYYTPQGKSLADVGIMPDHEVSLSDDQMIRFYSLEYEDDPQLILAAEVLLEKMQSAGVTDEEEAPVEDEGGTTEAQEEADE